MVTKLVEYSLRLDRKKQIIKNDNLSKGLIEIRMYLNRETSYLSTGRRITWTEWNEKKNVPKDAILRREIENIISELKAFESEFRTKNKTFALTDFKYRKHPAPEPAIKQTSFTDFWAKQLEAEKALKQPSWRTRKLSFDYFKKFRENVRFEEINYSLIESFNLFLYSNKASGKKLHTNTLAKHHKHLRKYILTAIKHRLFASIDNPYIDFKLPSQPYESNYLTKEELQRFEELTFKPKESMLERCRDCFLFACYTGLRYNDVYKLQAKHFTETLEGLELDYQANKTKKFDTKFLYLLFDSKPQTIARKYMPADDRTMFKGLCNPKINKALKEIAIRANVNKATKFKDSRNTFANIFSMVAPINVLRDEMQHSMLSTTQGYLKNNPELKKQALAKISWK